MHLKHAMGLAAWAIVAAGVGGMAAEVAVPAASQPATQPGGKALVIVKALYGDLPNGEKTDVTEKVKAMVKGEALEVEASNENFDDPAQGVIKKLQVEYTVGGVKKVRMVPERSTLVIAAGDPAPTKLIVKKAVWGDLAKGKTVDVTALVQGVEAKEAISLAASTDLLSTVEGVESHKMKVEYTLNGVEKTVTVNEGDSLELKAE